jgi:hypothetical protein
MSSGFSAMYLQTAHFAISACILSCAASAKAKLDHAATNPTAATDTIVFILDSFV